MAMADVPIVILGAGPTGLGAACRLADAGLTHDVHVIDQAPEAGGLSRSFRDDRGFLWDLGGHVIFSHYAYFNQVLDAAVPAWNVKRRASHVWMAGRLVPYPLQNNIHHLPPELQQTCLTGLYERGEPVAPGADVTFERWIQTTFGAGIAAAFMLPYNRKVWTCEAAQMSSGWVGERVAVPDVRAVAAACAAAAARGTAGDDADTPWGPNATFRYPAAGGTGAIWRAVAESLPPGWFKPKREVIGIDLVERRVQLRHSETGRRDTVAYRRLISTLPVDRLLALAGRGEAAAGLRPRYASTLVMGIGLRGQPPPLLAKRCWIYFPQEDIPFYRITVFSNYSDDHVPVPGASWSVMCEAAKLPHATVDDNAILEQSIVVLAHQLGWLRREDIVSTWQAYLPYGYPVPYMGRDEALDPVLHALDTQHGVLSRGRFGAWKYEVGNQDHSFMQGAEAAERLLSGEAERTIWRPALVNGRFQEHLAAPGPTPVRRPARPLEIVVARYNEPVDWLAGHEAMAVIYNKGIEPPPLDVFPRQVDLPNIGRESHTYLAHIVAQYDTLADVTLFTQGRIADSVDHFTGLAALLAHIERRPDDVVLLRHPSFFSDWRGIRHIGAWATDRAHGRMRAAKRTPEEFWTWMFGATPPQYIAVVWGATFAVRRAAIKRRSRDFYRRILHEFITIGHDNPEEGHYMERFWLSTFHASLGI